MKGKERKGLRELLEAEGWTPGAAADAVRVRAYLDDVLVRAPDALAARVPAEAAAAPGPVGGPQLGSA